jgi:PatG C-terminal/Subtilase family/PatG Domain
MSVDASTPSGDRAAGTRASSSRPPAGLPGLDGLWAETTGDPSVCVAVLDGPVDLSHPAFAGAAIARLETLVEAGTGEAFRHGTQVASVIFGRHGGPVSGIAPGCRGLIVPVFEAAGRGGLAPCSQVDLARAIIQAVELGAQVINISGGALDSAGVPHRFLADAVRMCAAAGALIVAATGNDGCECLHIPAALSTVLAVGAMDADGTPLAFSNWSEAYGSHGILAPGKDILVAIPGGAAAPATGSSFATAIVSGVVALLLSLRPQWRRRRDAAVVRDAILTSAMGCEAQPAADCRRLLKGRLSIPGAMKTLAKGGETVMSNDEENPELTPLPLATEGQSTSVARPAAAAPAPPLGAPVAGPAAAGCGCGCCGSRGPALVYALGQLTADFASEARRDSFTQEGLANPSDPAQLLAFLHEHPAHASAVTWILTQESMPIYALRPAGPFADLAFAKLREVLDGQLHDGVEQVSVPGLVTGKARLASGQIVPAIQPEVRGVFGWSLRALVEATLGKAPPEEGTAEKHGANEADVANFLARIYYEIRNLGMAPRERALNFAATNAFQVARVYQSAIEGGLKLDSIGAERSPLCRPESDCWDVRLTFFNPVRRLEQAREVFRFTVDVSDIVPVTVGQVRQWQTF